MEDSFKVRLDKAFGSLPIPSSSLHSLWSLTPDEINPEPEPEPDQSKPSSSSFSFHSSSDFRVELEKDIEDLDDDDIKARRGGPSSKPDDYDDEQWSIRSGIGLDCTLDFEEEEDQFDKQAVGKENSGDRLFMKDINDDDIGISSRNVLPNTFRDHVRDPRANHLAAKIRLKQDDEATAKKIDSLHVSEKSAPDIGGGGDAVNPKSILKNKDNPSEPKSHKRVRFDSECDDRGNDDEPERSRDVRMKSSSMEDVDAAYQSSKSREFASAVPDYILNPSRYTHYTFDDSSSDMDDKSNKEACMSFLSQLRASKAAAGTGSQADDALDDLPSVTFISKKKSGDTTMGESDTVSKQKLDVGKELMHRGPVTVSIAADGDTENCDASAMEEDEAEVAENAKKSLQKSNRQYRKKTQDELEEPVV
ncbi:hypothetical protein RIF29_05070 [Crotalaria pallida]|uniref:U5 small nuclear ribonucleoprotein TSSC4 n=1 Tax=Crotalaria pallida TaxID=3830 RepID=A0AAN9J1M2_CROPI